MSDIQRWDFFGEVGINEPVRYLHLEAVQGRYVTYADHVAAVAAARAGFESEMQELSNYMENSAQERYRRGRSEGKEAAYLEMTDERQFWPGPRGFDYDKGYAAGLKAAREAVAAHIRADLTGQEMFCGRKRGILAAIDALRGGS